MSFQQGSAGVSLAGSACMSFQHEACHCHCDQGQACLCHSDQGQAGVCHFDQRQAEPRVGRGGWCQSDQGQACCRTPTVTPAHRPAPRPAPHPDRTPTGFYLPLAPPIPLSTCIRFLPNLPIRIQCILLTSLTSCSPPTAYHIPPAASPAFPLPTSPSYSLTCEFRLTWSSYFPRA